MEKAFDAVKSALTSDTLLKCPDENAPFVLQTDASGRGIGAVLNQMDEKGNLCPTAFYSRKLKDRERNYAGTQLECLAIVEAVKHFRVYLSNKFAIHTDSKALLQLEQYKEGNPRLMRWALSLQPFNFTIEHRPGTDNGNADGLSRQFEEAHIEPQEVWGV